MLFIALPGEFDKFKLEGLIKDKGNHSLCFLL